MPQSSCNSSNANARSEFAQRLDYNHRIASVSVNQTTKVGRNLSRNPNAIRQTRHEHNPAWWGVRQEFTKTNNYGERQWHCGPGLYQHRHMISNCTRQDCHRTANEKRDVIIAVFILPPLLTLQVPSMLIFNHVQHRRDHVGQR